MHLKDLALTLGVSISSLLLPATANPLPTGHGNALDKHCILWRGGECVGRIEWQETPSPSPTTGYPIPSGFCDNPLRCPSSPPLPSVTLPSLERACEDYLEHHHGVGCPPLAKGKREESEPSEARRHTATATPKHQPSQTRSHTRDHTPTEHQPSHTRTHTRDHDGDHTSASEHHQTEPRDHDRDHTSTSKPHPTQTHHHTQTHTSKPTTKPHPSATRRQLRDLISPSTSTPIPSKACARDDRQCQHQQTFPPPTTPGIEVAEIAISNTAPRSSTTDADCAANPWLCVGTEPKAKREEDEAEAETGTNDAAPVSSGNEIEI